MKQIVQVLEQVSHPYLTAELQVLQKPRSGRRQLGKPDVWAVVAFGGPSLKADTVSCTQAEALVLAAEARLRRPTRLLRQRIQAFEQQVTQISERLETQQQAVKQAKERLAEAEQQVQERKLQVAELEKQYQARPSESTSDQPPGPGEAFACKEP